MQVMRFILCIGLALVFVPPSPSVAEELKCSAPGACCCGLVKSRTMNSGEECCATTVTVQTRLAVSHIAVVTGKQKRPVVVPPTQLVDVQVRNIQAYHSVASSAAERVRSSSLLSLGCMLTT